MIWLSNLRKLEPPGLSFWGLLAVSLQPSRDFRCYALCLSPSDKRSLALWAPFFRKLFPDDGQKAGERTTKGGWVTTRISKYLTECDDEIIHPDVGWTALSSLFAYPIGIDRSSCCQQFEWTVKINKTHHFFRELNEVKVEIEELSQRLCVLCDFAGVPVRAPVVLGQKSGCLAA